MKQTKLSDFKNNQPSLRNSLITIKKKNFIYKSYYWLMSFNFLYKNKKSIKYTIISLSGELVDFLFLFLFTEVFNIFYLISAIFSYLIALSNNFFLNLRFTFKYTPINVSDFFSSFLSYFLISFFGLIFNIIFIAFFVEVLHINYLLSKLIASLLIFFFMFTGHNFIIGKRNIKLNK